MLGFSSTSSVFWGITMICNYRPYPLLLLLICLTYLANMLLFCTWTMADIANGLQHCIFVERGCTPWQTWRCAIQIPFLDGSAIQLQGVWSADTPAVSIFEVSFSCRVSPAWKSSSFQNSFHLATEPCKWLGMEGSVVIKAQHPSALLVNSDGKCQLQSTVHLQLEVG